MIQPSQPNPAPADWPERWREYYEERAAIFEFEAGMDRKHAEMRARTIIEAMMRKERRKP